MADKKIPYTREEMTKWQFFLAILYSIYFHIFKFFWTYWAGYLLALTTILSLLFPLKMKKKIQHIFASLWGRGIIWFSFVRHKEIISPNVDFKKTYLFVGNHSSSLDIYLYQTYIKSFVNWIAKRSLFSMPFVGSAMWALGHVPTYRDNDLGKSMKTLQTAVKRLKDGYSMCVFPEGTRSYDGKLLPFKKGAFTIAKLAKRDIVPIVIKNVWLVAPKGKVLINPFVPIEIKILDPINYADKDIVEKVRFTMQEALK